MMILIKDVCFYLHDLICSHDYFLNIAISIFCTISIHMVNLHLKSSCNMKMICLKLNENKPLRKGEREKIKERRGKGWWGIAFVPARWML